MRSLVVVVVAGCSFRPGVRTSDPPGASDANVDVQVVAIDAPPPPFMLTGLRWVVPCLIDLGSYNCTVGPPQAQTVVIDGSASQHWAVMVRIRGAMEEMTYTGAGTALGWHVGGAPSDGANNIYRLDISSPPQRYWLNNGTPGCNCSRRFDYTVSFPIDGGATVTFLASGQDTLQWSNYDASRVPIQFPGVTTTPDPYNGQFAQLDVLAATPM